MNLDESLREILNQINNGWDYVISDYCTSKEQEEQTELDKQKELTEVVAKIKALVVESLPGEETPDGGKDYFDETSPFDAYGIGYNQCLGEIRSMYSDKTTNT